MNGPPDWVLGERLTTPCLKNINMLRNGINSLGHGQVLAQDESSVKGT